MILMDWCKECGRRTGHTSDCPKVLMGAMWYLADQLDDLLPHGSENSINDLIKEAKENYTIGLSTKERRS